MARLSRQKEEHLRGSVHEAEVVGKELDAVRVQLKAATELREDFVAYMRDKAAEFELNRNLHPVFLDLAARLESGAFTRREPAE